MLLIGTVILTAECKRHRSHALRIQTSWEYVEADSHPGRSSLELEANGSTGANDATIGNVIFTVKATRGSCPTVGSRKNMGCADGCTCAWGHSCYLKYAFDGDSSNGTNSSASLSNIGICQPSMPWMFTCSMVLFMASLAIVVLLRISLINSQAQSDPPLIQAPRDPGSFKHAQRENQVHRVPSRPEFKVTDDEAEG